MANIEITCPFCGQKFTVSKTTSERLILMCPYCRHKCAINPPAKQKKKILDFIPGFRTRNTGYKSGIAVLYYLIVLLFELIAAIGFLFTDKLSYLITWLGYFIFLVSAPFFIMNLITAIRHKNKTYFIVSIIACVLMIAGGFAIKFNPKQIKAALPAETPVATSTSTPVITFPPTKAPAIMSIKEPNNVEVPAKTSEPEDDIKNEMQTFLNTLKEDSSNTIVYVEAYTDKIFFVSITNSWYMWGTEQKEYIVNSLYTALKNKLRELTGNNDPIVVLTVLDENQKIIAKSKTSGGMELK